MFMMRIAAVIVPRIIKLKKEEIIFENKRVS